MIIDAHVHAFPHHNTASGFEDAKTNLMRQQNNIRKLWGRLVTNTVDEKYIPSPDEEVNFRVGKYGRYYWTKDGKESWLQRFPLMMVEMEWPPEHMIAFMDTCGVDMGVLQAGYMEINYCREYFAECMRVWPNRFIGTITIDYDIKKSEKYREQELKKLKESVLETVMKGVYQGFPRGQRIDDDEFEPFWKAISDLNIPHIFYTGFQPKQEYLDSLNLIEKVLKKFPDLTGIIGHLGGNIIPPSHPDYTNSPTELMKILRLPNAYFEVGYVLAFENWNNWKENYEYPYPLHTEIIKRVYEEIGAERLLWGSDMPNTYRTCTYRQCIDLVRLHFDFLTEEEKSLILGGNTVRIFRV